MIIKLIINLILEYLFDTVVILSKDEIKRKKYQINF
jgi:hypothetical protein